MIFSSTVGVCIAFVCVQTLSFHSNSRLFVMLVWRRRWCQWGETDRTYIIGREENRRRNNRLNKTHTMKWFCFYQNQENIQKSWFNCAKLYLISRLAFFLEFDLFRGSRSERSHFWLVLVIVFCCYAFGSDLISRWLRVFGEGGFIGWRSLRSSLNLNMQRQL